MITPIDYNHKMSWGKEKDQLRDNTKYRELIRELLCLTFTKPNISYDVHVLSQYMDKPSDNHLQLGFLSFKVFEECTWPKSVAFYNF